MNQRVLIVLLVSGAALSGISWIITLTSGTLGDANIGVGILIALGYALMLAAGLVWALRWRNRREAEKDARRAQEGR